MISGKPDFFTSSPRFCPTRLARTPMNAIDRNKNHSGMDTALLEGGVDDLQVSYCSGMNNFRRSLASRICVGADQHADSAQI